MLKHNYNTSNGFTLVEMLVVIPMVVLMIGVMVGLMSTLVNDVVSSNGSTQLMYDAQDALGKIEQDTFLSLSFLSTFTPQSPQGMDNGVQAFTSATGTSSSIILNEYATSNNPMNVTRDVVYYANRPQPCSGNVQSNDPFYTKVIYFIKNNTLYRRVIVPANNQNATPDANTTCTKPWQRGSCASGSGGLCVSVDSTLITNVNSIAMNLTYYDKATGASVSPTVADSVKVTLTITKNLGGKLITITPTLAASQANAESST